MESVKGKEKKELKWRWEKIVKKIVSKKSNNPKIECIKYIWISDFNIYQKE